MKTILGITLCAALTSVSAFAQAKGDYLTPAQVTEAKEMCAGTMKDLENGYNRFVNTTGTANTALAEVTKILKGMIDAPAFPNDLRQTIKDHRESLKDLASLYGKIAKITNKSGKYSDAQNAMLEILNAKLEIAVRKEASEANTIINTLTSSQDFVSQPDCAPYYNQVDGKVKIFFTRATTELPTVISGFNLRQFAYGCQKPDSKILANFIAEMPKAIRGMLDVTQDEGSKQIVMKYAYILPAKAFTIITYLNLDTNQVLPAKLQKESIIAMNKITVDLPETSSEAKAAALELDEHSGQSCKQYYLSTLPQPKAVLCKRFIPAGCR